MEHKDPGIRWSGIVLRARTYEENLQRLAEDRWLGIAAQWLTRHGEPKPDQASPRDSRLLLRGVRGLTSDGEPHSLQRLAAGLRKVW